MKIIISIVLALTLFGLVSQAHACTDTLMQPNPSYINEITDFTVSGTANTVSSIWLVYGYQPNESKFFVDIPGWTCSGAWCSGNPYTGTYTAHLTIDNPEPGYIGRFADDVSGQCPMDEQTIIPRTSLTPQAVKPGDANGDTKVDETDYGIWLSHFDKTIPGGITIGDFNADGKVDGVDYSIWISNYTT
jgi:hypothetical protein